MADTPMHRQYKRIKKQYPDAIVFFRLGDFYETFDDDAAIVSQVCDVVLTRRNFAKSGQLPMAGVPYHSAEAYMAKLIAAGYKVAVAEQMQQPRADEETERRRIRLGKSESTLTANWGKGGPTEVRPRRPGRPPGGARRHARYADRAALLDSRRNNYLAAAIVEGERAGIAYVDITTGEFQATELRQRHRAAHARAARAGSPAARRIARAATAAQAKPPAPTTKPGAAGLDGAEDGQAPRKGHHTERAAQNWRVAGHITPTEARAWTLDNTRAALLRPVQGRLARRLRRHQIARRHARRGRHPGLPPGHPQPPRCSRMTHLQQLYGGRLHGARPADAPQPRTGRRPRRRPAVLAAFGDRPDADAHGRAAC